MATDALIPYARNPRRNDEAIDRMIAAIQEFGLKIPLLARSDGQVVDGHLRLKAAQKLKIDKVPVILCDEWTAAQVKAFRLLVNRSATWAEWDEDLLRLELADLRELSFDLSFTGFDGSEIDELLFRPAQVQEITNAATAAPEGAITEYGDLWLCGEHRILCGDSTVAGDVDRLVATAAPLLMVTDPPYGVSYDPQWRQQAGLGAARQSGKVANDDRVDWTPVYRLFGGNVAYVWHAGLHASAVAASLLAGDFEIRAQIIWAKQHFVLSRGNYHWQHEPCWYAVRRGRNADWCGDRTQSTLWELPNLNPFGNGDNQEAPAGHGTQKPVELMKRSILNHTRRGDAVYDPFLGSGTTLIAAESTDRLCLGLEIEPTYVNMAILRWQSLTKKSAVLAEDGRTFEEVRVLRQHRPSGMRKRTEHEDRHGATTI